MDQGGWGTPASAKMRRWASFPYVSGDFFTILGDRFQPAPSLAELDAQIESPADPLETPPQESPK